ncbi:MAG: hypothetical protein GY699_22935 [Desulfobacteraceae bacterium]|nr:hypothetical protein [Desulfobacteraceae bacterium]
MKKLLVSIIMAVGILFSIAGVNWADPIVIHQISNNDHSNDDNLTMNNSGQMAWRGKDGSDRDIRFYDGSQINTISDFNTEYDDVPQINDNGHVVWRGDQQNTNNTYYYDGIDSTTTPYIKYAGPKALNNNGNFISTASGKGYLGDKNSISQITTAHVSGPMHINNLDQVVFSMSDGNDYEIYMYHNGSLTQITYNNFDDFRPVINDASQIAWTAYWGSNQKDVFFYNNGTISQLTDNQTVKSWVVINQIGQVAWDEYDGNDYEIMIYNGSLVEQITTNEINDTGVSIDSEGWLAWGTDTGLFFYNTESIIQLTYTSAQNVVLKENGHLAWLAYDDTDREVFYARIKIPTSPLVYPSAAVSTNSNGEMGDEYSGEPVISQNGRYLIFHGTSSNFVQQDINNAFQIFIKDLSTNSIQVVTTDVNGDVPIFSDVDVAIPASVSNDGRFVLFVSDVPNLTPLDTVGWDHGDLFLKDLQTNELTIVSSTTEGTQGDSGWQGTYQAAMTPDGNFVSFISADPNLLPDGENTIGYKNSHSYAYRKNLTTGELELVSTNLNGDLSNDGLRSEDISISNDGRYISFTTHATNLAGNVTGNYDAVYVKDMVTGQVVLASCNIDGNAGARESFFGKISGNGQFVVFNSQVDFLESDTNASSDIYRKDLITGVIERASLSTYNTQGNRSAFYPDISDNGQFIVFQSDSYNLVVNDSNNLSDIFIKDMDTSKLERINISHTGQQMVATEGMGDHATDAFISGDALTAGFTTWSASLVPNDTNHTRDIFTVHNPFISRVGDLIPDGCVDGKDLALFINQLMNSTAEITINDFASEFGK